MCGFFCVVSLFYFVVFSVLPNFAITLLIKNELVVLLLLWCGCLCSVFLLHGAIGCDCGVSAHTD